MNKKNLFILTFGIFFVVFAPLFEYFLLNLDRFGDSASGYIVFALYILNVSIACLILTFGGKNDKKE